MVGILQVDVCQENELPECRILRERSSVIAQSVCGGLKYMSVGSFDGVNMAGKCTNAPKISFSPVFHSGFTAEVTTNVGYRASKIL
jgi:hypothetical protein